MNEQRILTNTPVRSISSSPEMHNLDNSFEALGATQFDEAMAKNAINFKTNTLPISPLNSKNLITISEVEFEDDEDYAAATLDTATSSYDAALKTTGAAIPAITKTNYNLLAMFGFTQPSETSHK